MLLRCALVLAAAITGSAQSFPEASITNGVITAKFYVPDAKNGYYRGTRFDWGGQIYSLQANGHEYFGQWFPKYDPNLHDSIQGPVEEFLTGDAALGYVEAQPGETFVRIGVGVLRKPEENAFNRFKTYEIVDGGTWKTTRGKDWIRFEHRLTSKDGYSYRYAKTIRAVTGKPEMTIDHELQNLGKKPLATSVYDHNFFVIDGKPTGPGVSVAFPFTPSALKPIPEDLAAIEGKRIVYRKELAKGQSVFTELSGFSENASDYDVRLEHQPAGAAVRIRGDRPIEKIVYWSIQTTFCPELYINVSAKPGESSRWRYTYDFEALKGAR